MEKSTVLKMVSQCVLCKKGTAADPELIICFGCEKPYHGACVNLSRSTQNLIKETTGLKWYCLNCDKTSFADMISQRLNTIEGKVDVLSKDTCDAKYEELLKRIDSMTSEVSNIKDLVDQSLPSLVAPGVLGSESDEVFRPRKRFRSGRPKESTSSVIRPSMPDNCIRGTDELSSLKVIEPMVWYHVSRFDPVTTAEDLKSHILDKIGSAEVECYPLVPRGRDSKELRFITFKLGVLNSCKSSVTDPSIWPSNVTVRPFRPNKEGFSKLPKRTSRPHQE